MLTKYFWAAAAGLLCGIGGLRAAASLRRQTSLVDRWVQLLRRLALLMREGCDSLPVVFTEVSDSDTGADRLMRTLAAQLRTEPMTPLPDMFRRLPQEGPETKILDRMMARLCHGTLEARVTAVEQAEQEMSLLADELTGTCIRDAQMWARLGWALGACVTLLLL